MLLYNRIHYFGLGPIPKPNWPILLADTVTITKTTFQRENLVTDIMRYFFNHKRAPKPNLLPNIKYFKVTFEDLGSFSRLQIIKFHKELEKILEELEKNI